MISTFTTLITALASHLRLAYRVLRRTESIMDSCKIPAASLALPAPSSESSESESSSSLSESEPEYSSPSLLSTAAPPQPKTSDPNACHLLNLPSELIDGIMDHLSPYELIAVSATCKSLRTHALSDVIWQARVQENVPGVAITSPAPCPNYCELYAAHDLTWFLPKYKIWFCDRDLMGKLIVVRYDPRRGCIEGYQLLASRNRATLQPWATDDQAIASDFDPQVSLHLDKPVLQFRLRRPAGGLFQRPGTNRFSEEIQMDLEDQPDSMFSNFLLSRPLDDDTALEQAEAGYPYGGVWPPPAVPSRHRISGASDDPDELALDPNYRPTRRSEVSNQTFRVRQWMEMAGSPITPNFNFTFNFAPGEGFVPGGGMHTDGYMGGGESSGIRIGEEIISYSTVDPSLYTPTPLKPWRGLWVGDYSGHGCEFILIHQPDDEPATDAELGLHRYEDETDEQWEKRRMETHTYRGRLEAIKLTGDPNVPRGEHTFIVDDLGPKGYLGDAAEAPFTGARTVKSRGHVAEIGFMGDKFIDSQLMLISHDRLAMNWVEYGHVSYFQRVDIDQFLKI